MGKGGGKDGVEGEREGGRGRKRERVRKKEGRREEGGREEVGEGWEENERE